MNKYQLSAAIAAVVASLGACGSALAEGMIHHESHEHGHATLNAVQQGKDVELSFNIPAMDVVGFEHQPKNTAQEKAVHDLAEYFKKADQIVMFPSAAECEVEDVKVESALLAEDDHDDHDHDKHEDHDDKHGHHNEHKDHHDHGHHAKHDHHDEHKGHHDEHKDHDDHGHEAHDDDEHSEFALHYHFECEHPESLTKIQFNVFSKLTTLEEIEVNWLGDKSSIKTELTSSNAVLSVQ